MRSILFVLLLAGCATPQDRARQLVAQHAPFCEALGYARGSDGWRQCILARIQQAQADSAHGLNVYNSIRPRTCRFQGNQMVCD